MGNECYCGSSYDKYAEGPKSPDSDCAYDCAGDSDRKCGGANLNSVYKIGQKEYC